MSGETFDVGIDTGSPVGPYPHDFRCGSATTESLDPVDQPKAVEASLNEKA